MTPPTLDLTPIHPAAPAPTLSVTTKGGYTREIALTAAQKAKITSLFEQLRQGAAQYKIDLMGLKATRDSRDVYYTSKDARIKALREEILAILPEDAKPEHAWADYNTGSRASLLADRSFTRTFTSLPTSLSRSDDIRNPSPLAKTARDKQQTLIAYLKTLSKDTVPDREERRQLLDEHIKHFKEMDLPALQFALSTSGDTQTLYDNALEMLQLNDGINRHAVEDAVHLAQEYQSQSKGFNLAASRALYERTRSELKVIPLKTSAVRRVAANFFAGMSISRNQEEAAKTGEARRDGAELFFVRAFAAQKNLDDFLGYAMQTTFGTLEAADRQALRQELKKIFA